MQAKTSLLDLFLVLILGIQATPCLASEDKENEKQYIEYSELSSDSKALALEALAHLHESPNQLSYDIGIGLFGSDERNQNEMEVQLSKNHLQNLYPLLLEAIDLIRSKEPQRVLSSLAIRVDPDTETMKKFPIRRLTSDWHTHGTPSYLFTIAEDYELATQVRLRYVKDDELEEDEAMEFILRYGEEFHIPLLTLVRISGKTEHRTPPTKVGKRIQFSIATSDITPEYYGSDFDENTNAVSPSKKRNRETLESVASAAAAATVAHAKRPLASTIPRK